MKRVSQTCVKSRIAAAPIRFLNLTLTSLFLCHHNLHAGVAESCFGCEGGYAEGYGGVKALQLRGYSWPMSDRDVFVIW